MKGLSITLRLAVAGYAAVLGTAAAVMVVAGRTASDAAVKVCTARLTSIAAKDATEQGAKKKAIDDWLLKAKGAGIDKATWRLAAMKTLICHAVPGPDKIFECVAIGHACSISQVAPKPDRRGPQRQRGFGVDT